MRKCIKKNGCYATLRRQVDYSLTSGLNPAVMELPNLVVSNGFDFLDAMGTPKQVAAINSPLCCGQRGRDQGSTSTRERNEATAPSKSGPRIPGKRLQYNCRSLSQLM